MLAFWFRAQGTVASLVSQASQAGVVLRAMGGVHLLLKKMEHGFDCLISVMVHLPYPLSSWISEDNTVHQKDSSFLRRGAICEFIAAPYHMMPAAHSYGTRLLLQLLQLKGMAAGWKLT